MEDIKPEHKVLVSAELNQIIKDLRKKLKERDVKDFSTEDFLDYLYKSVKADVIDQFVEQKTPISFKLNKLLNNPKSKKDLEKYLESIYAKANKSVDPSALNDIN
ncbi:MAG: hypothetical protein WA160_06955 [Pseudobdellovibrio sp.]